MCKCSTYLKTLEMHWYYSREETDLRTPSRHDGVDFGTEMRYRREGSRFIMDLGNKLGLRYLTVATGIVFFHRFYMTQSFKNFPRWVMATACLFLAGKVEETPKKCKDVLKVSRSILSDSQFDCFGDNPREEVMMYERILLQSIKFDLQIDHPYQHLITYGKELKGDKDKLNELVQKAWIFINDSLSTCLCLHYKPPIIALAMLHLAAKLSNQSMQTYTSITMQDWWRAFNPNIDQEVLDDICEEMLELYGGGSGRKRMARSRESGEQSATSSPASFSNSPNLTGSPPSKKKKAMPVSSLTENAANKDTASKPSTVENITPPLVSSGTQTAGTVTAAATVKSAALQNDAAPALKSDGTLLASPNATALNDSDIGSDASRKSLAATDKASDET